MKKILIIVVVATVGLLGGFAIPVLGHGLDNGEATPPGSEAWKAMHEACKTGDWEVMAETAEEFHEEFSYTACHGTYTPEEKTGSTSRPGGHMTRGIMGWH